MYAQLLSHVPVCHFLCFLISTTLIEGTGMLISYRLILVSLLYKLNFRSGLLSAVLVFGVFWFTCSENLKD